MKTETEELLKGLIIRLNGLLDDETDDKTSKSDGSVTIDIEQSISAFAHDLMSMMTSQQIRVILSKEFRNKCVEVLKTRFKQLRIHSRNIDELHAKLVVYFDGTLEYNGQAIENSFYGIWSALVTATDS